MTVPTTPMVSSAPAIAIASTIAPILATKTGYQR